MARGTRSSHPAGENNGIGAQAVSQAENVNHDNTLDMQVEEQEVHIKTGKGRKRKSPDPQTSPNGQSTSESALPLDLSPAKRTRSQLRGSNPLSPPAPSRSGLIVGALLNGTETETSSSRVRLNGTPTSVSPTKKTDDMTIRENGRRSSLNPAVPAASPAPFQGRATRGSNRVKARVQPAATSAETERDEVEKAFRMDVVDEGEDEVPGVEGAISRSKRRQILGVLLAMESNSSATDAHPKPPRSRLIKIVDVPFAPVSIGELNGLASVNPENGKEAVVKEEIMDGDLKATKEKTLRRVLLNRDEIVTVDTLLHDLSSLSARLVPSLPNPFADAIKRPQTKAIPLADANALTVRALGLKTKQDKDLPIYDHLMAVKETLILLVSQDASLSKALPAPTPKTRWALHQRTTVPWPMQPRRGEKSTPVIATDRVHLDWFTSLAATENGKLTDIEDDVIKTEGLEDQVDQGSLTRLQAEGYLGLAKITTVAAPDREAEEASRSTGPRLGKLLYTDASAKVRRYRMKRRETIPVGCPVTFLSHTNSFTPSFAPTYDSTAASGGWSFYSTLNAAQAASSSRQWIESGWNVDYSQNNPEASDPEVPSSDGKEIRERALRAAKLLQTESDDIPIDPAILDVLEAQQSETLVIREKLSENARNIRKLSQKQDERLRRGEMSVSDPEEHALASRVSSNLQQLASSLQPRALLPRCSRMTAMAADLATTIVSTPGPVYQGTLDPARPKAIAENYTVHTRDEPMPPKRRETTPAAGATPARSNVMLGPSVPLGTPTPMARDFSGPNAGLPPRQGF